ncbi:flagellar export protein FliJ [Candidatus Caldatribacterium saccharofermentans]|jgi:flagellar FliJ protein|uniref:Flagellar FliJ protein n=1 Tax=Candidatus Caldatribacterium saccharofermentans TaxID=1454753 RepID=A0A7V4TGY3_9BACT
MKGYHFRLQKVLDTCRLKEELIEVKLAELERLAESQRAHLSAMEEEERALLSERRAKREQEGAVAIEEEIFYERCLENLRLKVERLRMYLRSLEEQIRQTREELVAAAMERKVLEKLREKDYERFTVEVERNNQKALDEIAVQRYARREDQCSGM